MTSCSPGEPQLPRPLLSVDQVRRVQESWGQIGPSYSKVGQRFYASLFAISPDTRALFGDDREGQTLKFMRMLDLIVVALGREDEVRALIGRLGRRHRGYGVVPADYEAVGASLLAALGDVVAGGMGEADRDAWDAAYGYIRDGMFDAAGRDGP